MIAKPVNVSYLIPINCEKTNPVQFASKTQYKNDKERVHMSCYIIMKE